MPANYFDAERQKWWWTRSEDVDKVYKLLAHDDMHDFLTAEPACICGLLQEMTDKFGDDLKQAAADGVADWQGGFNALAAVILMDQMSR